MPYGDGRAFVTSWKRIEGFPANEINDATAGASANVQDFLDARRRFRGNVADLTARDSTPSPVTNDFVYVESVKQFHTYNGTIWVETDSATLGGAAPATAGTASTIAKRDGSGNLTAAGFSGSGASLTALNATQLTSGTVPLARISGLTNTEISASAAIDWTKINKAGSSLADLATRSAADLSSGTLADGRLSANVPLLNAANTFSLGQLIGGSAVATPLTLFRDTNAGDSTNVTQMMIGNSGANQGTGRIQYTNAAAAGSPTFTLSFQPRNNANTASINPANIIFTKTAAADTASVAISNTNGNITLAAGGGVTTSSSLTVGSGFTVSAGSVSLPAASIADAALSSNVPLKNASNTFSDRQIVTGLTLSGTTGIPTAGGTSAHLVGGSGGSNLGRIIIGDGSGWDFTMVTRTASTDTVRHTWSNGNYTATGTVTANLFSGSGASLTSLNGSNISTGTIADARLSTNVPLENAANVFTSTNNFQSTVNFGTGSAPTFAGGSYGTDTPEVYNSQTTGEASVGIYVNDGTNNRRIKLFVDQTNAVWGFKTAYSSGSIPFVINEAGTETFRLTAAGAATIAGGLTVTAGSVSLPAASIADAALSSNVGLLTGTQTFTGAKSFSGGVTLTAGNLTLFQDPTSAMHAATKQYVDNAVTGLDMKASCRLATAAALPAYNRVGNVITATANAALSVDSVAVVVNDRILVKNGAADADNGIYVVTATGSAGAPYVLTRASDADDSPGAEVSAGMYTFIEEGTTNADTGWVLSTNEPITLNSTALTFTQFTGLGQVTAGAGLTKTGSQIDVVAADSTITVNADSIQVGTGSLTNTHINASAAIAYSKLSLSNSIVNADIAAGAAIADTKLATISTAGKVSDSALSSNVALKAGGNSWSGTQSNSTGAWTIGSTATDTAPTTYFGNSNLNCLFFDTGLGMILNSSHHAIINIDSDNNGSGEFQIRKNSNAGDLGTLVFSVDENGLVTGTTFSGSGASLTALNGSNISTGTVADARLSANVALLNAANTFTGANTFGSAAAPDNNLFFSSSSVSHTGGLALTNTTPAVGTGVMKLTTTGTATVAGALLTIGVYNGSALDTIDTSIATFNKTAIALNTATTVTGTCTATTFSGSGASLTSLNGSNISTGTVANARTTGTANVVASTLVLRDGNSRAQVADPSAAQDIATKNYVDTRFTSGTTFVDRETPTGTINGSNAVFTLANTPITGSEHVYVSGLMLIPTTHYTISTNTITFVAGHVPQTGEWVRVSYRK